MIKGWRHPAEDRIAACADFLLGISDKEIFHKYRIMPSTVRYHLNKTGHFKMKKVDRMPRITTT